MTALAEELGAAPSRTEDYILGGSDAPEIPADVVLAPTGRYAATETVRSPADMPLAPRAEPKKGGWGLFGRKKAGTSDLRAEPAPAPRAQPRASQPRANVQPLPEKPATGSPDDLFPENGPDEQFEIPAFLRRQSGQ
jgi:hypothetical protein